MTNEHPITPPPELLQQWLDLPISVEEQLEVAARWGADAELEASCEVLARELICDGKHVATDLRAVRRPKPPSLKETAIVALETIEEAVMVGDSVHDNDLRTIRRALEQLDD